MHLLYLVCGGWRAVLDISPYRSLYVGYGLFFSLWLHMLGRPASALPGVLTTGVLGFQYALLPLALHGFRDLNLGPHACPPVLYPLSHLLSQ